MAANASLRYFLAIFLYLIKLTPTNGTWFVVFQVAVLNLKKARNGLTVKRFLFLGWFGGLGQTRCFDNLFLFCAVPLGDFANCFSDCLEDLVDV